ncbi:hypothetical protein HY792_07375 [Candidatus Desantisbacteria bacterium]|nr:hypothetical protein [Candidatus Desantisbacteria bacterium]
MDKGQLVVVHLLMLIRVPVAKHQYLQTIRRDKLHYSPTLNIEQVVTK